MFVINPLIWVFTLLILSFLSKNIVRKKRLLLTSIILLYLFSNSFIVDEAMRLWEIPATPDEQTEEYDIGIVLGGMSSYSPKLHRIQFNQGTDRLMQTIALYKKGKIKKIFLSGGSGSILHPDLKECSFIKDYLLTIGIPEMDLLLEKESHNTRENALFTKTILQQQQLENKRLLLITSGFHMRRAMGCFQKAGLAVSHYSTDRYSGPRKFIFDHVFIPSIDALGRWYLLIHEITGYITYKISGYA